MGGTPPLTLAGPRLQLPTMPTPKKIVFTYDPDEFEEFVKEWVPALEPGYVRVERHGGSGDHGIDVAGYLTPRGLEGDWDNYQCKHYGDALAWSTALPEMRKMFAGVVLGHFTLPKRYVFVAPRIGPRLRRRFAKPSDAQQEFLKDLGTTTDKVITGLTPDQRQAVTNLAEQTDYSMFETIDMDVMLEQHRTTPHWTARFPQMPPMRPANLVPPALHTPDEARYIQQLLAVYRERWGKDVDSLDEVAGHAEASVHLSRQREAFYAAESLRLFARDATPTGHFEAVLEDVYDIVVEVADGTYAFGWQRLRDVLAAAGHVQLTETILAAYVRPADRKGVCHHLANVDRLIWCREGDA